MPKNQRLCERRSKIPLVESSRVVAINNTDAQYLANPSTVFSCAPHALVTDSTRDLASWLRSTPIPPDAR